MTPDAVGAAPQPPTVDAGPPPPQDAKLEDSRDPAEASTGCPTGTDRTLGTFPVAGPDEDADPEAPCGEDATDLHELQTLINGANSLAEQVQRCVRQVPQADLEPELRRPTTAGEVVDVVDVMQGKCRHRLQALQQLASEARSLANAACEWGGQPCGERARLREAELQEKLKTAPGFDEQYSLTLELYWLYIGVREEAMASTDAWLPDLLDGLECAPRGRMPDIGRRATPARRSKSVGDEAEPWQGCPEELGATSPSPSPLGRSADWAGFGQEASQSPGALGHSAYASPHSGQAQQLPEGPPGDLPASESHYRRRRGRGPQHARGGGDGEPPLPLLSISYYPQPDERNSAVVVFHGRVDLRDDFRNIQDLYGQVRGLCGLDEGQQISIVTSAGYRLVRPLSELSLQEQLRQLGALRDEIALEVYKGGHDLRLGPLCPHGKHPCWHPNCKKACASTEPRVPGVAYCKFCHCHKRRRRHGRR